MTGFTSHPQIPKIAEVIARLSLNGATPFAIACININAGPTALERRWPPERFAKVAERYFGKIPRNDVVFYGVIL